MLADAARAFLNQQEAGLRSQLRALLGALEDHLGHPAPLLALTPLTGERWLHSLPANLREDARRILTHFRIYLRESGWLDAALPVNQFD